jgi:hypothetical protein
MIFGSNDGLFFTTLDYHNNPILTHDVVYTYSYSDTNSYKEYVLVLSDGFSSMTSHDLNLSFIGTPTGLSSFVISNVVAMNASAPALDQPLFINKWFLILIAIALIGFGAWKVPITGVFGTILVFVDVMVNYSLYSTNELIALALIAFVGLIVTAAKMRR